MSFVKEVWKPLTKIIFKDEFAAVIPDNDSTQAACAKRLNIPGMNGRYFNAGVIYVNLKNGMKQI